MSRPIVGRIADDFTGGIDLAIMLLRCSMRRVQLSGVPANAEVPQTRS
ncbi:MAG: hypothetical protein WBR17_22900 [Paraburkholderia sp.]